MKKLRWLIAMLLATVFAEALYPASPLSQPVAGADHRDWNANSYWFPSWGVSGVHKGIDIFAKRGATVMAAQAGLVVYRGNIEQGGKVVLVLTPRGWLHYYAHLDSILTRQGAWVVPGEPIGEVGDTGNAASKPTHLHYAVLTLVPRPWDIRWAPQGWKLMFYKNPGLLLNP